MSYFARGKILGVLVCMSRRGEGGRQVCRSPLCSAPWGLWRFVGRELLLAQDNPSQKCNISRKRAWRFPRREQLLVPALRSYRQADCYVTCRTRGISNIFSKNLLQIQFDGRYFAFVMFSLSTVLVLILNQNHIYCTCKLHLSDSGTKNGSS